MNICERLSSSRPLRRGGILFCLVGFALSLRPGPAVGSQIKVQVGQTIEITSSYNYCWFPNIHQFPTGEIMASMRMSPDEEHPEGEFSAYCISKDGGHTWSQRYTVGAGANTDGPYSQVPDKDGTIWVLGAGYESLEPYPQGQAQQFHATLTKFSAGGMVMDQVRDALIHLPEPMYAMPPQLYDRQTRDASKLAEVFYAVPYGAIISGPNDEWLTTLYCMPSQDPGIWRLVVMGSKDEGHTWDQVGTISAGSHDPEAVPRQGNGPTEAGLVRLGGKDLYSIFRMESGHAGDPIRDMGEAWSSDDGKTWSNTVDTGFKGVAPHLRLLSNGILTCTYGRPGPVTIMFSLDGGKKWTNVTPVFNGMSTRYTDLIEVRPGEVLVIYDSVPYGWDPIPLTDKVSKNTIYATFVEVRKE